MIRYLVDHTGTDTAATQAHPENLAFVRPPGRLGFRLLGERVTSESNRTMTYAKSLGRSDERRLSDGCQQ